MKRRKHLRRLYGLTTKEHNELVNKQNGVCAICAMPPRGKNKENKLHVDHDHTTKAVRGLLCMRCNLHLAWMELFEAEAKAYLARAAANPSPPNAVPALLGPTRRRERRTPKIGPTPSQRKKAMGGIKGSSRRKPKNRLRRPIRSALRKRVIHKLLEGFFIFGSHLTQRFETAGNFGLPLMTCSDLHR